MNKQAFGKIVAAVCIIAALCMCWWLSVLWHGAMSALDVALLNPAASADHKEAILSRPVFVDPDCYMWIVHAKEARAANVWRLRYTHADNGPHGREMHWSQSLIWLERLASHLFASGFSDPNLRLEWAATWVNTILQIVFVSTAAVMVWRRLGAFCAVMASFLLIGMADLSFSFHPFRPDHQTLYCLFSMVALMSPVCGLWPSTNSVIDDRCRAARVRYLWFAAGGCAIGLLFWIGATVASIVLTIISIGWVGTIIVSREQLKLKMSGSEWLAFGIAAAITSLLMYLVEYAPNHLSWRLEVNHPLYCLSLAAHGALLCRSYQWWTGRRPFNRREAILGAGWAAIFLLPFAIAFFGGAAVFSLHHPGTRRMMMFIGEYQPYFGGASFSRIVHVLVLSDALMPVFTLLVLGYAFSVKTAERAPLIWLSLVAFMFWLVTLWQSRWCDVASVFAVLSAVAGFRSWRSREVVRYQGDFTISAVLVVVMLVQCYTLLWYRYSEPMGMVQHKRVDPTLIKPFMVKRFVIDLRDALSPTDRRPVMAEPELAPALQFYAGVASCSSSYWPNINGVDDSLRFFNDQSTAGSEARVVASQRNLSLVILPSGNALALQLWFMQYGSVTGDASQKSLLSRLLIHPQDVPTWLRENRELTKLANPPYDLAKSTLQNAYHIWTIDLGNRP